MAIHNLQRLYITRFFMNCKSLNGKNKRKISNIVHRNALDDANMKEYTVCRKFMSALNCILICETKLRNKRIAASKSRASLA